MTISIRLIIVEALILLALLYGMINLGVAVGVVSIPLTPVFPSAWAWVGFSWITAAFVSPFLTLLLFDSGALAIRSWVGHGMLSLALFGLLLLLTSPGSLNPAAFRQAAPGPGAVPDPLVATIEQALGDLRFRSPDEEAAYREITARLMRKDTDGAEIYLIHQAGLTQAQAKDRIADAQAKLQLRMQFGSEIYNHFLQRSAAWREISILLALVASALGSLASARLRARWPLRRAPVQPGEEADRAA